MKSKFLFFLVFLFTAMGLCAQTERTFESMGYDDQSIIGITGSLSYFLKVKPDDNVDQSKIVLHIRASQVLNPNNSVVVVYMMDQPVFTQRVTASVVDTLFTMVIPLSRKYLQPDGRFIRMKVAAKLSIGDEYCKDVDNPACWITVKNTSFVYSVSQSALSYQRSVKEWVQEFSSIYTPANSDLDDLTSGGILYTLLKQNAVKNIFTGLYHTQDSVPGGIITGVADKLPASVKQVIPALAQGQGLVMMARVNAGYTIRNVLVITGADAAGYRKAINLIASNRRISSAFTDKVIINDGIPGNVTFENASPLITSLEDLGGAPTLMEGIGGLKQKYTFSLTEFNAIPNKLTLHLESYFSVLKADDRGFLNIYLNQNLIYNASLIDKNNFINDIDLKPYLLSKFNSLEIEFRFHPGSNICKDGFSNFFAFINVKSSTLTFSGERENKFYSFFNFPAEFRKVPTKILVSPSLYGLNIISSIGELLYQLNSPIKNDFTKLIVPQLVGTDKTSLDDLRGFNLIALLHRNDPFVTQFSNLPVNYDKDFQLYKNSKGQLTYSVNDFSNSGMAQIFRERGSTVLLVTALATADSSYKDAFESVIKNFSTQLTEIESNVCIANSNGISNYFFKMPEDSDSVFYRGERSKLAILWETYKYWLLFALLGLVLLSFFFVRKRVRKSQEIV
jgi:hypothetical protein